jgi:hypothetical protein
MLCWRTSLPLSLQFRGCNVFSTSGYQLCRESTTSA